ncbi:uncharacterized protein MONBRDRAFT_30331 [Monosiga brevicollis MX1]|uniref:Uncharacterized protein n=1 Tax=Monosiga brevicollis TaxID=81824 RepID=A9VDN4_MONBE|nr:uncharacterized protein MONBRDRAFT_30331 [Monosiga brevicollis MX1]EDQ84353.1 predicted protein [Monosiga brevicollis MX1]|eukprot:XP_001750849.1 hypothetical protein [Monosiga brevicollis MX1]
MPQAIRFALSVAALVASSVATEFQAQSPLPKPQRHLVPSACCTKWRSVATALNLSRIHLPEWLWPKLQLSMQTITPVRSRDSRQHWSSFAFEPEPLCLPEDASCLGHYTKLLPILACRPAVIRLLINAEACAAYVTDAPAFEKEMTVSTRAARLHDVLYAHGRMQQQKLLLAAEKSSKQARPLADKKQVDVYLKAVMRLLGQLQQQQALPDLELGHLTVLERLIIELKSHRPHLEASQLCSLVPLVCLSDDDETPNIPTHEKEKKNRANRRLRQARHTPSPLLKLKLLLLPLPLALPLRECKSQRYQQLPRPGPPTRQLLPPSRQRLPSAMLARRQDGVCVGMPAGSAFLPRTHQRKPVSPIVKKHMQAIFLTAREALKCPGGTLLPCRNTPHSMADYFHDPQGEARVARPKPIRSVQERRKQQQSFVDIVLEEPPLAAPPRANKTGRTSKTRAASSKTTGLRHAPTGSTSTGGSGRAGRGMVFVPEEDPRAAARRQKAWAARIKGARSTIDNRVPDAMTKNPIGRRRHGLEKPVRRAPAPRENAASERRLQTRREAQEADLRHERAAVQPRRPHSISRAKQDVSDASGADSDGERLDSAVQRAEALLEASQAPNADATGPSLSASQHDLGLTQRVNLVDQEDAAGETIRAWASGPDDEDDGHDKSFEQDAAASESASHDWASHSDADTDFKGTATFRRPIDQDEDQSAADYHAHRVGEGTLDGGATLTRPGTAWKPETSRAAASGERWASPKANMSGNFAADVVEDAPALTSRSASLLARAERLRQRRQRQDLDADAEAEDARSKALRGMDLLQDVSQDLAWQGAATEGAIVEVMNSHYRRNKHHLDSATLERQLQRLASDLRITWQPPPPATKLASVSLGDGAD